VSDSIYLITEGEYDDRHVRWATADKSVADATVARDQDLSIEEIPLVRSLPEHVSVLTMHALLSLGALDERESEKSEWVEDDYPVLDVEENGPRPTQVNDLLSWYFSLTVRGTNHAEVRAEFADRLTRLLEQTAVPPKRRHTVEVDRSLYPRAAKHFRLKAEDVEFVRVGSEPSGEAVLVALRYGSEVRRRISEDEADALSVRVS